MLGEAERKKFRSSVATLNYMSLEIRSAIRREGNMHEDGESDTRELEESEEGSFDICKEVEKVTWAMRASKRDELKIDVHV